ncbi:MAG: rRNA maturation RNase YbeY [Gammaproteobacteria bacterium]|nr:rRNA maturation RNase YbeY [Gammaproteobacteria bacterium]
MVKIDLQNDEGLENIPAPGLLNHWVESSLLTDHDQLEQTIRVVGKGESRSLNLQYRMIDSPTNVLSFPSKSEYLDYECLGDLVICSPLVIDEALQQGKSLEAHWAHMVVHGMLHLQDFDHGNDIEAAKMETLEVKILSTLGYSNPYNDQVP